MKAQPSSSDPMELFDRLEEVSTGETVTIGELVRAAGKQAFGSVLILASLIALLPTGAIPGMSFVTGAIMLLVSVQLLLGADRVWLPKALARREVSRESLLSGLGRIRRWKRFLRATVRKRFEILLRPPFVNLVALAGVVLSLSNFVLGPLPFGSFPAGIAFIVIGIGLTARDGVWVAAGIALGLVGLVAVWLVWPY
jgi:hypothetical protein